MGYPKFKKIITNLFLIITFLSFGFCFPKLIKAQEENSGLRIFYQGKLLDSNGEPVEDGSYNMRFSIYDAESGGNILWQEEYLFYNAVSVKNGQFKIILGRTKPINLKIEEGPFWLEVSVGKLTEDGEIIWSLGTDLRKKIMSLSEFLKKEGLDYLEEGGITEKEWEEIYQLLEKKLGEQQNLVFLLDLGQLTTTGDSSGSQLFNIFKNFINFISEKISEIGNKISEIGLKIDEILKKIEEMTLVVLNIGKKVDRLYQVLVTDKGLDSEGLSSQSSETKNYTSQKFERMILREGEKSIRIFNQSVQVESLIFVSFLDDPGSVWWISEKVPGNSFTLSLKEPAPRDLRFDYWILEEETQLPEEQPSQPEESQAPEETKETEEQPVSTTTIDNQTSSEEIQPLLPEGENEEPPLK